MPTKKLLVQECQQTGSEMTTAFLLTKPVDSSIRITGSVDSSIRITGSEGNRPLHYTIGQQMGEPSRNTVTALHGDNVRRYLPVLTVKRPTAAPTTVTTPAAAARYCNAELDRDADHRLYSSNFLAFGRPVPPVECFQSKTPIASRVRNCSRATCRPLTDLRTGFMRTMSKPTPGELDLKLHQEQQALDKLKSDLRRQKASREDPDRLDMTDLMKYIDQAPKVSVSSQRQYRPRAAKRRVAHASLVSNFRIDSGEYGEKVGQAKDVDTQKAISEYKHRLNALSAQMRSARNRVKSAGALHNHGSDNGEEETKDALRLAPSYRARTISFKLASLRNPDGRLSSVETDRIDERRGSRLTPRATATAHGDRTEPNGMRTGYPVNFPDPIYIPHAAYDDDSLEGNNDGGRGLVKLSMRSASNVTRETSLLSDMDPMNHVKARSVFASSPRPTVPPANTPVSGLGSDDSEFDDDSLRTNWSPTCSHMSLDSTSLDASPSMMSRTPSVGP